MSMFVVQLLSILNDTVALLICHGAKIAASNEAIHHEVSEHFTGS